MGAYINSARQSASRAERLAIEKEITEQEQARAYAAAAPDRERAAQQVEYERRELRKDLILGYEGSDFTGYKTYDGRFPDAASVETAIRAAWNEFLAAHDLDQQAKTTITMFLQQHPNADITLLETWELALAYLESRLCPAEAPATVSVHATPVTVSDRYESVRQEISDLRAKAEKCAFDSKERNDLERRAMILETQLEVLGNSDYQTVMQTIVEQSGKTLSGAHSLQFRQWLASPVQIRRYGVNPTTQNIRFAFAEWAGDGSFLNEEEKSELNRRANVAGMTSDDIVRAVGKRNDYGPRVHSGIRQEGQ